jgi:hypothetical protein
MYLGIISISIEYSTGTGSSTSTTSVYYVPGTSTTQIFLKYIL